MSTDTTSGYLSGFGNEHSSESLPARCGGQESPQRCPTDFTRSNFRHRFTAPRAANDAAGSTGSAPRRVCAFAPLERDVFAARRCTAVAPDPLRWDPLPLPVDPTDFVEGLLPVAGNGSAEEHSGCASTSMRPIAR